MDREYQEVLKRAAPLNQRAALYRTVPGVGPITAATLVAELPELGNWNPKALTTLVGLASWSRDSGKQRKPSRHPWWSGCRASGALLGSAVGHTR